MATHSFLTNDLYDKTARPHLYSDNLKVQSEGFLVASFQHVTVTIKFMLVVRTAPINSHHKLRSQLSAFQVSLWVKVSIIAGKNIQDLTMASDTSSNEVGNRISLTSILVTIVGFISLFGCSSPHSQFAFFFFHGIYAHVLTGPPSKRHSYVVSLEVR